jgi:uncharacterized integral membrane protein
VARRTDDDAPRGEGEGLAARRIGSAREREGADRTAEDRSRTEDGTSEGEEARPIPTATLVARGTVVLLAVVFGVFALVNSQPVGFSWLVGETEVERDATGEVVAGGVPLIVLLLVSFILGAALGGWWTREALRDRRRRRDDPDRRR